MTNKRITYHSTEHSLLYAEVGGACPLCGGSIIFKKANSKHPTIGYEIAHIYPLNPSNAQSKALADLLPPAEINAMGNVILLCPTCHTRYDKEFKIEEYERLLNIKKECMSAAEARQTATQHSIQEEVKEILEIISRDNADGNDLSATNLDVSSLDKKLKKGMSPLQKRDIRRDAIDFYVTIKNQIKLIEQRDQSAIRILQNQISSYYLIMEKKSPENKDFVFNHIAEWISQRTGKPILACKVLASFFVQNCEVFDVDSN